MTTLYAACAAMVTSRDLEDPLRAIREKLTAYAAILAERAHDPKGSWSVYVERHIVGVRFMLRDATGREVDLQRFPEDPEELA